MGSVEMNRIASLLVIFTGFHHTLALPSIDTRQSSCKSTQYLCSSSNAEDFSLEGGPADMPGSESGGSSICNEIYDPTIWQQCIDKYFSPDVNFRPRLSMKRGEIPDSLCCATSDLCYTTNGLRFCFNPDTKDMIAADGSYGNLVTGDFYDPQGNYVNIQSGENSSISDRSRCYSHEHVKLQACNFGPS